MTLYDKLGNIEVRTDNKLKNIMISIKDFIRENTILIYINYFH